MNIIVSEHQSQICMSSIYNKVMTWVVNNVPLYHGVFNPSAVEVLQKWPGPMKLDVVSLADGSFYLEGLDPESGNNVRVTIGGPNKTTSGAPDRRTVNITVYDKEVMLYTAFWLPTSTQAGRETHKAYKTSLLCYTPIAAFHDCYGGDNLEIFIKFEKSVYGMLFSIKESDVMSLVPGQDDGEEE